MVNFFIADTNPLRQGTAETAEKGAEILKLIFPDKKAFVVENQVVKFAQNMLMDEAETLNPLKAVVNSITELPSRPKKKVVKKTTVKSKVKPKPLKLFKPKKTTVKSKIKAKTNKVKKTKVKSKVKPKAKKKVKARK